MSTLFGLVIEPGDTAIALSRISVATPEHFNEILGDGMIQALDIDGGSVLWIDEEGKVKQLPTNLLATKIAHRLNAGLYPDDTINGNALILGETMGPDGELVSADLTPATIEALRVVGIEIFD